MKKIISKINNIIISVYAEAYRQRERNKSKENLKEKWINYFKK